MIALCEDAPHPPYGVSFSSPFGLVAARSTRDRRSSSARDPTMSSPRKLSYLDEAVARREDQGLKPGVHAELVEDVHHVRALGLNGDVHLLGYLPALQTLGEALEHLHFPGGEPLDGLQRLLSLLALAANHTQHLEDFVRREQRIPGLEPSYCGDYLLHWGGLVKHAGGSGLNRAGEADRLQARTEDQRHYLRFGRREVLDQLEAVPVGEREVDDRDLNLFQRLAGEPARLGHRGGLRDHLELRLPLEHEGKRLAERGVVLDEQDPGPVIFVVLYGNRLLSWVSSRGL